MKTLLRWFPWGRRLWHMRCRGPVLFTLCCHCLLCGSPFSLCCLRSLLPLSPSLPPFFILRKCCSRSDETVGQLLLPHRPEERLQMQLQHRRRQTPPSPRATDGVRSIDDRHQETHGVQLQPIAAAREGGAWVGGVEEERGQLPTSRSSSHDNEVRARIFLSRALRSIWLVPKARGGRPPSLFLRYEPNRSFGKKSRRERTPD